MSIGFNVLNATYSGDAAYSSANLWASVTVSKAAITINPLGAMIAGVKVITTATLSASSTYSGTMHMFYSLTGSPAGAQSLPTCSVDPADVTVSAGGSANAAVTVNTTGGSATAFQQPSKGTLWGLGKGGTALVAMLLLAIPSRRRWRSMLALLLAFVSVAAIGCGGARNSKGSTAPATTAGAYTFTMTAVDSADSTITTSTNISAQVQ